MLWELYRDILPKSCSVCQAMPYPEVLKSLPNPFPLQVWPPTSCPFFSQHPEAEWLLTGQPWVRKRQNLQICVKQLCPTLETKERYFKKTGIAKLQPSHWTMHLPQKGSDPRAWGRSSAMLVKWCICSCTEIWDSSLKGSRTHPLESKQVQCHAHHYSHQRILPWDSCGCLLH